MAEHLDQKLAADPQILEFALGSLAVRPVLLHRFWPGGSHGEYSPIRREWAAGTPQLLGSAIGHWLAPDDQAMRLLAIPGQSGLPRREMAVGRSSDLAYVKDVEDGSPIREADVVAVTDIDLGRRRMLPLLRLSEVGGEDNREFALTLPDLAHYLQREAVVIDWNPAKQ